MSKLFVFAVVLIAVCAFFASAAPAGELLDAHTIIQTIIAEYEKLPGHSVHHPPEVAHVIDPHNFHIHF